MMSFSFYREYNDLPQINIIKSGLYSLLCWFEMFHPELHGLVIFIIHAYLLPVQ